MAVNLPMPTPSPPRKPFKTFKVISFDVYGTLIDFKPSIVAAFQPLISRLPDSSPYKSRMTASNHELDPGGAKLLGLFKQHEDRLLVGKGKGLRRFDGVMRDIYLGIAKDVGAGEYAEMEAEAETFGKGVGELPAFPDSVDACQRLSKLGYKLVFLSNIENWASQQTADGPLGAAQFWRKYTANDFEQDDPDRNKLKYLVLQVKEDSQKESMEAVQQGEILHVAQSLGHDHAPAKELGLSSVWIVRDSVKWGKEGEMRGVIEKGKVGYGWRFGTLKEFADAVENEWADENLGRQ
jgi:FMN phosphatase YigB (HAD superfamily)